MFYFYFRKFRLPVLLPILSNCVPEVSNSPGGSDIHKLIPMALEHSGYKLKTKGLMAMLSNGELFRKDECFQQLQPIYDVSSKDIEEYIKDALAR